MLAAKIREQSRALLARLHAPPFPPPLPSPYPPPQAHRGCSCRRAPGRVEVLHVTEDGADPDLGLLGIPADNGEDGGGRPRTEDTVAARPSPPYNSTPLPPLSPSLGTGPPPLNLHQPRAAGTLPRPALQLSSPSPLAPRPCLTCPWAAACHGHSSTWPGMSAMQAAMGEQGW